MKSLYAGLAVAVIALSGCSELAEFFAKKGEANLDSSGIDFRGIIEAHEQECVRAKINRGFINACSPHNSDRNDEHRAEQSDRRLKRDIVQVGTLPSGIHLYEFNYIWGGPRYVGVMAQDVLKVMPEAVIIDQYGFYRVDYSMIGTRMVLAVDQPQTAFVTSSAQREQRGLIMQ
jgi:hypothetical protein